MQEASQQVIQYLLGGSLISLAMALLAGLAAGKTVAYEWKTGILFYFLIGVVGLFLSQFVIVYFALNEYLELIPQFRIVIDFIAAYVFSFLIATVIHFAKPM